MVSKQGRVYVVGRSVNTNRPTVMHVVPDFQATITGCGTDVGNVSRSYTNHRIDAIFCLKAGCRKA